MKLPKWLHRRKETSKRRVMSKNEKALSEVLELQSFELHLTHNQVISVDMAHAFHLDGNDEAGCEAARVLYLKYGMTVHEVLQATGYWVG